MRVAVEIGFVQSCPDCRAIVANLSAAAIADPTVTRFAAVPGRKHAHDVADGASALPGLSDPAASPPLAVSDTNGDAPDAVAAALFADDGTNGFDPPGRE